MQTSAYGLVQPSVVKLRDGWTGDRLFLVPGLEGSLDELAPVTNAFVGGQQVYGISPNLSLESDPSLDLAGIAAAMIVEVRKHQACGPYQLGGYSFGGLIAFEMAQQLRSAGERVSALTLIDAVYDERYWSKRAWAEALMRRTLRQIRRIVVLPPPQAFREVRYRAVRLAHRVLRRRSAAIDPLNDEPGDLASRATAVIGTYKPKYYDGWLTVIAPTEDRHFGTDTAQLWARLAERVDIRRIVGDHLTIMDDSESARSVAQVIDHRLGLVRDGWPCLLPRPGFERPMIVTTMKWFSTARLGNSLLEAGFGVSVCKPKSHPLDAVEGFVDTFDVHRLYPIRSIARAIEQGRPDIVLPGDERSLALLRRLQVRFRSTDPDLAGMLARSLGAINLWPTLASRSALANVAGEVGVSVPATDVMSSSSSLSAWVDEHCLPAALKTDGSWGGRGVVLVDDASAMPQAWKRISSPPSVAKALIRLAVDRDAEPLSRCVMRRRPVVNAQSFVTGREGMATVACIDGTVLAMVCLEVVAAMPNLGAATVVRVVQSAAMKEAATALVRRLGLSGLCGFDFMLTPDGKAVLLELNPRITPTAYLLVENEPRQDPTIALFPADPGICARHPEAVVDRPGRAPRLAQVGDRIASRRGRLITRLTRRRSLRQVNRVQGA